MTDVAQIPEAARLSILHACRILDTPSEQLYDELTMLAATATGAPVALLSFFDAEREWVKARYRWNISHIPRRSSFAAVMIGGGIETTVSDLATDTRFASNALVISEPKIRFFAGVPILSSEGAVIGALSVYDRTARSITDAQLQLLRTYASQVSAHVNSRRRLHEATDRAAHYDSVKQALTESDERFRELFDNVDDFIMTFRNDGRILHVNSAAAIALGGDSGELPNAIFDLVHPEARVAFREALERVVRSRSAERVETTLMRGSGGRVIVDGTLIPKVVDDYVMLVRVIFRDITERKRIEVELSHARDAALESARLKTQFLSNISHEIRTPIHALTGMLGLLLESPLAPEQRDFATTARASADALLAIINNILHVSRLEAGKLSISIADFDVVTTVERVVEVMKIAAQEKGIEFKAEYDPALPAVVRGDPGRYRQVLVNLLTNAVKFTERGRVTVRVGVERETDTHTLVRLAVVDTGIGVPEQGRERIFTSFYQVDGSTTRLHGGMGLGLSIAKQLVDLMGGVIGCDSLEGEGSTFWFTIPFEKRVTERLAVEGTRHAFPGARVLVVDQSETNRKLVQHYVTSWGMRSRTADSEVEALERLRAEAAAGDPYQVVIFDFQLRPNGGLHLARMIKADPSIAETGLVMQTYLGDQLNDEAIRTAGVAAYLAKPVDKSELFDCLAAALARESLRREIAEPAAQPHAAAVAPIPLPAREELKILLAEDKPLNQKLTLSQLRSLGYSADAVSNGNEVIDALAKKEYDIILMDCQMPQLDGYETTMEIRRREGQHRRTKIIAMTANAMDGDREKCLAAGMDDYLSKPTKRDDLDAALARAYHGM